jgi:DNA polymerase I-like protein with 3'-5' exonuclease and polymerase domains
LAARLESRDQAKTFIYAFIYGAGDAKIGSIVGGSRLDGKRLKERFLSGTPALAKLRDRVFRAATTGRIKGLDGRYLQIRSEHSALNVLLQGAGAIVMKKALVIFYKDLLAKRLKPSEYFVANIHDEWQLDVPEHLAESVANVGVNAIRKTAAALGLNCPLDGGCKIGNNWAETH